MQILNYNKLVQTGMYIYEKQLQLEKAGLYKPTQENKIKKEYNSVIYTVFNNLLKFFNENKDKILNKNEEEFSAFIRILKQFRHYQRKNDINYLVEQIYQNKQEENFYQIYDFFVNIPLKDILNTKYTTIEQITETKSLLNLIDFKLKNMNYEK